jgi:hydrogenase maturation protease
VVPDKSLLFLGIGNEILTDDGIGIKLLNDLQGRISFPGVSFLNASNGGLDILEMIKDFQEVIIIDAIKTTNGRPGEVYYFTPEDVHETLHISNFHDISFLDAIKLGQLLKINIPGKIHIIAIEIVDDMEFNDRFSPLILEKYDKIKSDVLEVISRIKKTFIS